LELDMNDANKKQQPKVFISYSHKDEQWKDRLVTHLRVLEKQALLDVWDDRRIKAGEDWQEEIRQALNSADIAILMISANFLTSDFILGEEVPPLLERRQNQGLKVIPLITKPCVWQQVKWLRPIQARPKDGKPLSRMRGGKLDEALAALAKEILDISEVPGEPTTRKKAAAIAREQVFTARLPSTTSLLLGRERELEWLDEAWESDTTHIFSLVAWGGVGKTALVNYWLTHKMGPDGYRGAQRVYGWSFYSQGTREDRQASSDIFLVEALKWFGDAETAESKKGPWDKGLRLAELVQQHKTLLILDGVEPLQYPPGPMQGRLKDQGLQPVLKQLAAANNGLCVVTTRQRIEDINAAEGVGLKRVSLENLSEEAGRYLLRRLGVKRGSNAELEEAAEEFGGHALALSLLGSYLATVHDGEIRKRDLVGQLTEDEEKGGHAKRIMGSYEIWLKDTPELNILYLMGLFDRPAPGGAIDALKAEPPIEGLTEKLQNLSDTKWKYAVKRQRDLRLLGQKDESDPDTLDCHPLVREYFGEKLQKGNPAAWRQAHSRLYEYYKAVPEKELPDTLEEMQPLFAAVGHGCQGGLHQKALIDVYWDRISRKDRFFSRKQLGASGSNLSALAGFFDELWTKPAPGLTEPNQAGVLNWAGFALRAVGRLREAAQPMKAGLNLGVQQEVWKSAGINAGNLSELYLTLGEVKEAADFAERSVEYADRSGDAFERYSDRATLADALHQAGDITRGEELFREAEEMQKQHRTEHRYLYSVPGFRFCDLLLSQGRYREVQERASQTLEWAKHYLGLLDVALDTLSLGRC
jgi:tetratricopeptide (TPR) repeat protein